MFRRIRTQAWITFVLHRFTLTAVALGIVVLAAVALYVASQLYAAGPSLDCLRLYRTGSIGPDQVQKMETCQQLLARFFDVNEHLAGPLVGAFEYLPVVAGILAGVGLVGREIEERTASIAWSLTPSRRSWLLWRVFPVALVFGVLLVAASMAASEVERAREPLLNAAASFDNYGARGWVVVGRGLIAFAVAVLLGAAMGRVLPAIIASAALAFVLLFGVAAIRDTAIPSLAVTTADMDAAFGQGSLFLGQMLQHPDGRLEELGNYSLTTGPGSSDPLTADGSRIVSRIVPGSRYGLVEAIETAAMGLLVLALAGATWLVVRSRRPA